LEIFESKLLKILCSSWSIQI